MVLNWKFFMVNDVDHFSHACLPSLSVFGEVFVQMLCLLFNWVVFLSRYSRDSLVPLSFFAIRMVLSAYLWLLAFLPIIWILACASSSLEFLMRSSACKLNKQGFINLLWCTNFRILNKSVVACPVLTVASWPTYRFHRRQVM